MDDRATTRKRLLAQVTMLGKLLWVFVTEAALLLALWHAAHLLDATTDAFKGFLVLQAALFFLIAVPYVILLRPRPHAPHVQETNRARAYKVVSVLWRLGFLALLVIVAFAIAQRTHMAWFMAALFWWAVGLGIVVLCYLLLADAGWNPYRGPHTPSVLQIAIVLVLFPIVASWAMASLYWHATRPWAPAPEPRLLEAERSARASRQAGPVAVAATLSGGAYRATAFHAGVLEQLEAENVPIHYLSTNSGGAIIGAWYATGQRPDDFLKRYKADGGPRLSNDFFALAAVLAHAAYPGYASGDTFMYHLERVFLGQRRLGEPCTPTLLINVTDYASGENRTFRCPAQGDEATIPLARAVAASGAIPVIAGAVRIGRGQYMDGASRDNLGYVGLQKYLVNHTAETLPAFLIMSNTTLPLELEEPPAKVWLDKAFLRGYVTLLDEERSQMIRYATASGFRPGLRLPGDGGGERVDPAEVDRQVAGLREGLGDPKTVRILRQWPGLLAEMRRDPAFEDSLARRPEALRDLAAKTAGVGRKPTPRDASSAGAADTIFALENAYTIVLTLGDAARLIPQIGALTTCGTDEEIRSVATLNPLREPTPEEMDRARCVGREMLRAWRPGCRLDAVQNGRDPNADNACGRPPRVAGR